MEFLIYLTAPTIAMLAMYVITKTNKHTKNTLHILNHKKPFYGSLLFAIAITTPLSLWVWYARHYIEKDPEIKISGIFSAFQYIFEENLKGGIGFASLSLLLGVMIARFHSSKQNSESIKMTLESTIYSNAFSHRKEFTENFEETFNSPYTREQEKKITPQKAHSYFFSLAFSGIFRGKKIKDDFKLFDTAALQFQQSLEDLEKKDPVDRYRKTYKSLTKLARASSEITENMGANFFEIDEINLDTKDGHYKSITKTTINHRQVHLNELFHQTQKSLELIQRAFGKSAHFLPEIDPGYSRALIDFEGYIKAEIRNIEITLSQIKRNMQKIPPSVEAEELTTEELEIFHQIEALSIFSDRLRKLENLEETFIHKNFYEKRSKAAQSFSLI